ncbi:PREDICTED: formin-1-like [Branchiostoma belcheri]|uniref:Formin-1-like n=1 Tax=Branchiostoma belcheri TaxID=7741 RepID=A0A6P4ZCG3_BRABE|nr:PREDICTED: formin-1-like [Branchiostoma belcheri]
MVSPQVRPSPSELPNDYAPQNTLSRGQPSARGIFKRQRDVLYSIDESTPEAFGDGQDNNHQPINSSTPHAVNGSNERCDLTDYVTVKSRFQGETCSSMLRNTTVQMSRGSCRNALFVIDANTRPVLTLRSRTRQSMTYDGRSSNSPGGETHIAETALFRPTTKESTVSKDNVGKMDIHVESGDTSPNKVCDVLCIPSSQKRDDVTVESVDFVKVDKCPGFGARCPDSDVGFSSSDHTDFESRPGKPSLMTEGHVANNTAGAIVPPAPPPPPSGYSSFSNLISPTKPLIRPKLKMRPLFWKRIVLEGTSEDKKPENFWSTTTEPSIDTDELERLFGVSARLDSEAVQFSTSPKRGKGKQVGKVFEDKRSRDVAIRISRLQMSMEEVQEAIYKMDAKRLDLDRLQGLYDMRATEKELAEIKRFKQENKQVVLDKPEEFLLQLAEVHNLQDRLECWIFTERFSETMFNLHQQMNSLMSACSELRHSEHLHAVLRLVLAAGNYMNGSTPRGQADGYQLDILAKLRDVRTKDKSGNLLQYIVRQYCRRRGDGCGPDGHTFRLPTQELMKTAREACLKDSRKTAHSVGEGLKRVKGLVQKVLEGSEASMVTSFRCKMKPFLFHAELTLKREVRKLEEAEDTFKDLLAFFDCKDPDLDNPSSFFEIWERFCQDFYDCWTEEQKRLAKEMFQNVENDKKARRNSTTTRELTECSKGSLLKARFSRQNSLTDLQDGEAAKSSENCGSAKQDANIARTFDTSNVSPKRISPNRSALDDQCLWGGTRVHGNTDDDMDSLTTIDECQTRGCEVSDDLGSPDDGSLVSASYVYLTDEPSILDAKEIRGACLSQSKASGAHDKPGVNWGYYGQKQNHGSPAPAVRVMYQGSTLVVSL